MRVAATLNFSQYAYVSFAHNYTTIKRPTKFQSTHRIKESERKERGERSRPPNNVTTSRLFRYYWIRSRERTYVSSVFCTKCSIPHRIFLINFDESLFFSSGECLGSGKRCGKILQRFPEKDWSDTPFIDGIEWVSHMTRL